jgi:hypothetical protein
VSVRERSQALLPGSWQACVLPGPSYSPRLPPSSPLDLPCVRNAAAASSLSLSLSLLNRLCDPFRDAHASHASLPRPAAVPSAFTSLMMTCSRAGRQQRLVLTRAARRSLWCIARRASAWPRRAGEAPAGSAAFPRFRACDQPLVVSPTPPRRCCQRRICARMTSEWAQNRQPLLRQSSVPSQPARLPASAPSADRSSRRPSRGLAASSVHISCPRRPRLPLLCPLHGPSFRTRICQRAPPLCSCNAHLPTAAAHRTASW